MLIAMLGQERVRALPGLEAICPDCCRAVVAKCGPQVTHHFAHRPNADCQAEWEPETEWHRWWKSHAPIDRCEINLGNGARADVLVGDGLAVEFQRKALAEELVAKRERAWEYRVVWVVDARQAYTEERLDIRSKGTYWTFAWKHPSRWWTTARGGVCLDLGDQLFAVRAVYNDPRMGGWGHPVNTMQFATALAGRIRLPAAIRLGLRASVRRTSMDQLEARAGSAYSRMTHPTHTGLSGQGGDR